MSRYPIPYTTPSQRSTNMATEQELEEIKQKLKTLRKEENIKQIMWVQINNGNVVVSLLSNCNAGERDLIEVKKKIDEACGTRHIRYKKLQRPEKENRK